MGRLHVGHKVPECNADTGCGQQPTWLVSAWAWMYWWEAGKSETD